MQTKTFSKLVGALAYLFGKIKASEDSGHVVIVAFWLGKYWVLAETHLRAVDVCPACDGKGYRLLSWTKISGCTACNGTGKRN